VTNLDIEGPGSLHQAIVDSNNTPGPNDINFAEGLGGWITLLDGESIVNNDLTIHGREGLSVSIPSVFLGGGMDAPGSLWIDRVRVLLDGMSLGGFGVIVVDKGALTVDHSQVEAWPGIENRGGDVMVVASSVYAASNGGRMTVVNCTISNAWGIENSGTMTIADTTIGHIYHHLSNSGTMTIADTTIRNSWGIGNSGTMTIADTTISRCYGIKNTGTMTASYSTFCDNWAEEGGAFYNSGTLTLRECTVSNNVTDLRGGGILNLGTLNLLESTVSGNQVYASDEPGSGSGIFNRGLVNLANTIVAGNTADGPQDIDGPVEATSSHNLIGVVTGLTGISNGVDGNMIGTADAPIDPMLGPLQDNGGPTWTMAPLPGSPAIDAGDNSLIPAGVAFDQRGPGFQRIVNGTVDIGAVEWQPYVASATASWGSRNAALDVAADNVHLLPPGRKVDLPWMNVSQLAITLSVPMTLTADDVTVSSTSGRDYGPVALSGSGTGYTIALANPIDRADHVTFRIGLGGMVTRSYTLDVLPGDVNDDGIVNAQDMVLIRNAIQKTGDPLMIGWADVDGDGVVSVNDYVAARKKLGSRLH
jgi:hypothetical protein